MADKHRYPWDVAMADLMPLFADPWGAPLGEIDGRQAAATFFAMRSLRRVVAIDAVFSHALYNEAYQLIRAGYEDWITLAYILQAEDSSRWSQFQADVAKIDARVYAAFERLCGSALAAELFTDMPPGVRSHLGRSNRELNRTAWPGFATMADALGLRKVHDYVYTWLSVYAHPTNRSYGAIFDTPPGMVTARRLRRRDSDEVQLALWGHWFELRVLTLALSEFGIDKEPLSDDLLDLRTGNELVTCVLVREGKWPIETA